MYEFDVPYLKDQQRCDMPYLKDEQRHDMPFHEEGPGNDDDIAESIDPQSISNWPALLVGTTGIILLLVGLWASVHVLLETMRLYHDPVKIEHLTTAIERGSNLDFNLTQKNPVDEIDNSNLAGNSNLNSQKSGQGVRLSYFVAWLIALFILLLVSMIAFTAMRTGSELILQNRSLNRNMKVLAKELGKQLASKS